MPSEWPPGRIRAFRDELGLTQRDLGLLVSTEGISFSSAQVKIARYESGMTEPSLFTRMQLDRLVEEHELEL